MLNDTQTESTTLPTQRGAQLVTVNEVPATLDQTNFPVLGKGAKDFESVTEKISGLVLRKGVTKGWVVGFGIAFMLLMLFLYAVTILFVDGIGIWGINVPVAWGFDIVNFVWWIGIGHAGTLISAILLLLRQDWRTSINRFAEAMTLFAVACAGMFPILHLGRPQLFYWLLPYYPNTMALLPQFRSPLLWDVFAVSTYGTVSLLFWFVGLIPDLASLRDRATTKGKQMIYGALSLGWRGSAVHWKRYTTIYMILAGLSTPLVLSVHTVVSFDFAVSQIPGWHATIFPPYFVAGAIFSGFAMVLTLGIPLRKYYGLEDYITPRHLNNMAKVMLATGLIVVYGYSQEAFMGWYSGAEYEKYMIWNRMTGPYAPAYWALIFCNGVVPQLLWMRKFRTHTVWLWCISIVVNVGMWLERYVIIAISLHRDFVPSAWGYYNPTFFDWATYIGTMGLFLTLFFLFIRFLPVIAVSEVRELVHIEHAKHGHH
ncbi:MAG: polysulfide reductase NrfD [Chlorobi bacterium]|nr:polysulfide reductase NrfD [Chlorobiota bacterium]